MFALSSVRKSFLEDLAIFPYHYNSGCVHGILGGWVEDLDDRVSGSEEVSFSLDKVPWGHFEVNMGEYGASW